MKIITFVILVLVFNIVQAVNWRNVKVSYQERPGKIVWESPIDGHIVGGDVAYIHQFPHQAAIFMDGSGFCGGSLITIDVVMFAAHCSIGRVQFEVHLGAQDLNNLEEPDRVIITSTSVLVHPDWDPVYINSDLALIFLPSPVTGTGIEPIRLPAYSHANDTLQGAFARASGWGKTSDASLELSPVLKYGNFLVINNAYCENYFGSDLINIKKLCVDNNEYGAGLCSGDSGGPLTIVESDGKSTQIGIVSFGSASGCEVNAPFALTRVSAFLQWLEQNAGIYIRP